MNFDITKKQEDFISKVDSVCKSLRSVEEECYIEDRLNEKLIPEFSKIGMLGCPISKKYGGLGFDILTYCKSLERIGEEGNSMRTFFSVHTSIGQMNCRDGLMKIRRKDTCLKLQRVKVSWPLL